jgi:hypothetical protein
MEGLKCFKRNIIYKWGIVHCHVWLLEGGLKKQGDIRWSNTSTLNMCVVLLFLLRIVIRHWTQHARQDLKMLNAMKLINRKKRLQETRVCTQRQLVDPWTPRKTYGKRQIPEVPVDLWGQIWTPWTERPHFFLGSDRLELPSLPNHGFVKIYYPLGNYHHCYIFLANSTIITIKFTQGFCESCSDTWHQAWKDQDRPKRWFQHQRWAYWPPTKI